MIGLILAASLMAMPDYSVVWHNTKIDLPLGESIYDYDDFPKAELMMDGTLCVDDDMYYEKEVDRTSLSVINTNIVKEYHVNYRVIFPTYGIKNTITITFNIIDNIKPTIVAVPVLSYPLGAKTIEYLQGLTYNDNYYQAEDIIVNVLGKEQVKTNIIGNYPITYQIIDGSNNILEVKNIVSIYDDIAPTIVQKKDIIINPYENFIYQNYLEIKDNHDLVLNIIVDDTNVNYHQIGNYPISIKAIDKSGNATTEILNIRVMDTIPPELILISGIPEIEVFNETIILDLKRFILNITDNFNQNEQIKLHIMHDIDIKTVGTYEIIYEATDASFNTIIKKMKIKVVDTTKPAIILSRDLVVEVNNEKPNFLFFFEFTDNYSSEDDLKIAITEKVNVSKLGYYELTVKVTDENDNKKEQLFYVRVVDLIAPVVSLDKDIIITDFLPKEYYNYLTITDNYDKTFLINFDDSGVDYQNIGIYELIVLVSDNSGNETVLSTEIIICDIEPPVITLKQSTVFLEIFTSPLDYLSYILKIEDNYDELSLANVIYFSDVNYDILGKYVINYQIFDSSNNYSEQQLAVFVDDYTPPVITVTLPKETSEMLNLLDYVEVFDNYDGNISQRVVVSQNNLDYQKSANYQIKYYCFDSRGNYSERIATITVFAANNNNMLTELIPYFIVFISASAIIVFVYIKKRK